MKRGAVAYRLVPRHAVCNSFLESVAFSKAPTRVLDLTWERMVENAKDTLCRNVTIYGKCRFEDKGEKITPANVGV
jgi:hypothetical protein